MCPPVLLVVFNPIRPSEGKIVARAGYCYHCMHLESVEIGLFYKS